MKCQCYGLAELARTDTSTSCAPATGISTSARYRTSCGAPYRCWPSADSRADHPDLRQAQAMPSWFARHAGGSSRDCY